MNSKREFITWAGLALAGLLLLTGILIWQHKTTVVRGAIYLSTDPAAGSEVFNQKGCATCHEASGSGGLLVSAPGKRPSRTSLPKLVSAMWNHAPRMWERMRAENLTYPELSYEETAQLVSYLYMTGYVDEIGDPDKGEALFRSKKCLRCHAIRGIGGNRGPDLSTSEGVTTPMAWIQIMWNHGSEMETGLQQIGLAWPSFQEDELRDLYAYVRQVSKQPVHRIEMSSADPENGWKVFQRKGCMSCHSLNESSEGHIGPDLGPDADLPPTFFRFGELMLNHFPTMRRVMKSKGTPPPTFQGKEMADVVAFVYSLRYLEPGGSPHVGQSVFSWRGCSRCHGDRAEGTKYGPALRGRGQSFTAIRLATILWRHGAKMYQESQKLHQGWPELKPSDVGDLLAFLNFPIEK
ncbi:MAG: c-type cytochrome [Terriglobales bacterium]